MFYRGIVTANDSPTKDGRVQVRIFELHGTDTSAVKDIDLPWAEVMQGIDYIGYHPSSKKAGMGKNTIIELGTWVFVMLDHNNPNYPIVIGTIASNNEIHELSNPLNQITETVSGHIIEIDDNSGNERIHIHHMSGTDIEIMPDGTINIHVIKDVNIQVDGVQNEIIEKDVTETYKSNLKQNVTSNVTETFGGNQKTQAGGTMDLDASTIFLN